MHRKMKPLLHLPRSEILPLLLTQQIVGVLLLQVGVFYIRLVVVFCFVSSFFFGGAVCLFLLFVSYFLFEMAI